MRKIDPEVKRQNKLIYDRAYNEKHREHRRKTAREYMRRRKVEKYMAQIASCNLE